MNWIIIAIIVVLIITFIKLKAFRHKFVMITILIILLLVYITYSKVAAANSIVIKSPADILKAAKIYFGWLGNAFSNAKLLTSNVAKMEWEIKNKTAEEQ